jgi:hypothetical protein
MSLLKNFKLLLIASTVVLFAACAGSSGGSGSSDDEVYYEDDGSGTGTKKAVKKEVVTEDKLKDTEKEATALTEENHKLRREIFDSKTKLGIPVEQQTGE